VAQEDVVSIIHYQNKLKTTSIIKPNQNYNEAIFKIIVPSEIYNSGEITVKKFFIGKTKTSAKLSFHKEVYTNATYTVSSIKNLKKILSLLNVSEIEKETELINEGILISYSKVGRKYIITLKSLA
jgi:hypothetical protein